MKSNMIADDPAQTFRRLYEAKNPRAIDPDDDRAIPADDDDQQNAGEYGMGMIARQRRAGRTARHPESLSSGSAARCAPPFGCSAQGLPVRERDDDSDDDTDDDLARRMRFTCSTCETGNRITGSRVQARARRSGPRGGRFFADHYRGRLQPSHGASMPSRLPDAVPNRADMAADDGDDAAVTAFREAAERTRPRRLAVGAQTVRAEVAMPIKIAKVTRKRGRPHDLDGARGGALDTIESTKVVAKSSSPRFTAAIRGGSTP